MFRLVSLSASPSRRLTLWAVTLIVGVGSLLPAAMLQARPGDPRETDRRIALLVSTLMDRRHLSGMRVNNQISERAMEMYFETLDPLKLYFTKSDVDQFMAEKDQIDDYLREGDVRIAKRIFDVFLARVETRIKRAHEWVDANHDFSVDETMIRDPEKLTWVETEAEADDRWRKRVKFDLLLQTVDKVSDEEARDRLHKRYRSIGKRWEQTDNDELLEMFLTAVTSSFDPHSSYMSPSNLQNFMIQMRLELNGIGATLESKYGETVVRSLVPGGAADKDGRLQVDDVITGVGQGPAGEILDITDMKLNDVVMKIRGKPESIVRLEVRTAETKEIKIYNITRARIELKDSEARGTVLEREVNGAAVAQPADEDGNQPTFHVVDGAADNGNAIRIGVINLPSFYMDMDGRRAGKVDFKSTTRDMRRILEEFKEQDVDLVVVDLRFNGGGSLPEAVDSTGLFIDKGPVVQVKGPDGRKQPYRDEEPGAVWNGPLVVVINKFSASASEIFAGAIQDYGRGIVVGDHATHGKGTVQQLDELGRTLAPLNPPNYGALKMTIQQFYRPGGDSTQNQGVVSDIELPSRTTHWEVGESDLKYALAFDRVLPLPHDNYRQASAQIIAELRKRSQDRVDDSEYFETERQAIERYLERKEDPTVTLNREKFLAERKELNTEKDQEEMFEDMQSADEEIFPDEPYNQELVAICLDYLELLGDQRLAKR